MTSIFSVSLYFRKPKKYTVTSSVADGQKTVVLYLPDVTHTHTKKQECGWFTDSGFGLTIFVVLGVLKPRGANLFCLESAWLWTEERNPRCSKSWGKSVHVVIVEMKPTLVLVNELVYCTQNKAVRSNKK